MLNPETPENIQIKCTNLLCVYIQIIKKITQIIFHIIQGNNKQLANNKPGTGQQQQQQQQPTQQQQQQQQQGPLIGNKPITQSQGTQHLVIGSLGELFVIRNGHAWISSYSRATGRHIFEGT